mgnify:CR=1 FL=1
MSLLQGIETEAIEDGLEEDEAEDMAVDAVVIAIALAFGIRTSSSLLTPAQADFE